MKIAFVGNCQVVSLAVGMSSILPEAEIYWFQPALERAKNRLQQSFEKVLSCDFVFVHHMDAEIYEPLRSSTISSKHPNVMTLAPVAFTGFHPDMMYLRHGGKEYDSVVGNYHSRIVAACHSLGLSEEQTIDKFNAMIFHQLDYRNEFDQMFAVFRQNLKRIDFDLDFEIDVNPRIFPFMHTINHPTVGFLSAIARRVAINAGLVGESASRLIPAYDPLTIAAVWPVYPPLARARGICGSYSFKRHNRLADADGGQTYITLRQFVGESLRFYRDLPREVFSSSEITKAAGHINQINNLAF